MYASLQRLMMHPSEMARLRAGLAVCTQQMHPFKNRLLARVVLTLCVTAGVALCWVKQPPPTHECAVAEAPFVVGGPEVQTVYRVSEKGREQLTLDRKLSEGHVVETRVRLSGDATLEIDRADGSLLSRSVNVLPRALLYCYLVVFGLVAWVLPYALAGGKGDATAWYQLLSEPMGGYSLARVQLLVWSVPVAVIYGAMSVASRSFMTIDTQLQVLLGLSGATTFISTAASPAQPRTANGANAQLSDMVTDWNGHGDVSRYQYLLLSIFGAVVIVVTFLQKLELPSIPTELLWLVGGSQATYIATKAVKQAQQSAAGPAEGEPAPASTVVGAPAALTRLEAMPARDPVPVPPELGTADGSVLPPS